MCWCDVLGDAQVVTLPWKLFKNNSEFCIELLMKKKVLHHVELQLDKTRLIDFFYYWTINLSRSHITWANWSFLTTMQKKKSGPGNQPFVMSQTALITNCYFTQPCDGSDCWIHRQAVNRGLSIVFPGDVESIHVTCCSTSFYTSCQLLWMTFSQLDLLIFLARENTSINALVRHVQHLISWLFSLSQSLLCFWERVSRYWGCDSVASVATVGGSMCNSRRGRLDHCGRGRAAGSQSSWQGRWGNQRRREFIPRKPRHPHKSALFIAAFIRLPRRWTHTGCCLTHKVNASPQMTSTTERHSE